MAVAAVALGGCSAAPNTTGGPATTSTTAQRTSATGAANLLVTNAVRAQLLTVGAAFHGAPVSEYKGLAPGLTYYAIDRTTGTYWAGAKLVPAPSSDPNSPTQAQVASQDDGAYTVFSHHPGGSWHAYDTGATGQDTRCPVTIPSDVLKVWGWPAGTCRPANA